MLLGLQVLSLILISFVLKGIGRDFQTERQRYDKKLQPVYRKTRDSAPIGSSIFVNKAESHLESVGAAKGPQGRKPGFLWGNLGGCPQLPLDGLLY